MSRLVASIHMEHDAESDDLKQLLENFDSGDLELEYEPMAAKDDTDLYVKAPEEDDE